MVSALRFHNSPFYTRRKTIGEAKKKT